MSEPNPKICHRDTLSAGVDCQTNSTIAFKLTAVTGKFHVRVVGRDGREPVPDLPFEIRSDGGKVMTKGRTSVTGDIDDSTPVPIAHYTLHIDQPDYPADLPIEPVADATHRQLVILKTYPEEQPPFIQLAKPDQRVSRKGRDFLAFLQMVVDPKGLFFPPAEPNREDLVFDEIVVKRNIPSWMDSYKSVKLVHQGRIAKVWVMPDYLSIGTDDDYVRMSMGAYVAQRIADAFGLVLITNKIAEAVYAQSHQLLAHPMPNISIATTYFQKHEDVIQGKVACSVPQHQGACVRPASLPGGTLIAGHKKDVGIGKVLDMPKSILCFFGFYTVRDRPAQKLKDSGKHQAGFCDYSQGVRMALPWMTIDGKLHEVVKVLDDDKLAGLISEEGRIPTRYRTPAPRTYPHGDN